jgi:predicted thioesterase
MLSLCSRVRFASKATPDPKTLDLRKLLTVGQAAGIRESLIQSDVDMGNRMHSHIDRLTANLIDLNSTASSQTAGFYVRVDPQTQKFAGKECMFSAEVTEVTPTEAMFRVEVRDASNGVVIGTADYERVVVGTPYKIKLMG